MGHKPIKEILINTDKKYVSDGNIKTIIESLTTSADFNGNVFIEILETIFNINDIGSVINCQKILELILINHIITDKKSNKDPDKITIPEQTHNEWLNEFEKTIKIQKILLVKDDYHLLQNFNKEIKSIEQSLNEIKKLTNNFNNKISNGIKNKDTNLWTELIDWLDKNFTSYINKKSTIPETEFMTIHLVEFSKNTLSRLKKQLDKEIKDFLHSEVNKEIILTNKKAASKWKEDLKEQVEEKNKLIQSIEKDIHSKLKDIVSPFDSPFMKSFYSELFTRCYKNLLSPEKEKTKNSTFSEKTDFDINHYQIKKMNRLPSNIESELNDILLSFFKYMCNNETNINEYAKSKTKKLSTLINSAEITEKQKRNLEKLYHHLYKSSRHYEKNLNYLKKQLTEINKDNTLNAIKKINSTIEQLYHEYKPLLIEYIDRVKNELTSNDIDKRRALIKEHDKGLIKIRNINKIIEISRVISKIISKKNTEINTTIKSSKEIQTLIVNEKWRIFYEVWKNQDTTILNWLEAITKEIKINIDVPFRSSRKPLKGTEVSKPNYTSLLDETLKEKPTKEESIVNNKL